MSRSKEVVESELPNELKTILENVIDKDLDDIGITDDLTYLEIDSVMMLEIMVTLERVYGVKLDQSDLKELASIRSMMDLLITRS